MRSEVEDLLDLSFLPEINRDNFHRDELVDIPKKLLRELIINAIVHRDYTIRDKRVGIVASEDKIEVRSPGAPIISLEKIRRFAAPSVSRNPKLAYIFYKTGLVEERGMGMKELKAFKDNNELPDSLFKIEDDYFIITVFRRRIVSSEIGLEEVVRFIKERGEISSGDYANHFGVTPRTALRHLNRYLEDGVLGKEGEKKGTKYFLLSD